MSEYFKWNTISTSFLEKHLSKRAGETKLGEVVCLPSEGNEIPKVKFHLLGISEDIGPRLNKGRSGARFAFEAFISRFLNVQSNQFLSGKEICLHGWISPNQDYELLEHGMIDELDALVSEWTSKVVKSGGIPIVIGGGHNNAYPLIKGVSEALNKPIHVCNLDPHADTRSLEGRHSGNPFSYAYAHKYLKHYSVLGLHESYNNQAILDQLHAMKAHVTYFETWLDKSFKFQADIDAVYEKQFHEDLGLELDMDAIAYMPTSAITPSGITLEQARIYVRKLAGVEKVCYLHLPEAAPQNEIEQAIVGKALSYLVLDFIKEYLKHHH